MFKRELKTNFKGFLIWTGILLCIFLVVFLVYPSIVSSENIKMMDEMIKVFPEEILKALNMDISSIDTAYGWLKSEGLVFILLIIGSYGGIIGSNILLKEENDKTVEYLNSLPLTRKDIVLQKFAVGIIYVILITLILVVFNFISLSLSGDFDKLQFILLSITPLFPSLVIYALCFFISTFAHKSKKMLGLSLGIVFISYILNTLSGIAKPVEFLKYFSLFTLADVRNVILDVSINPVMIIITIIITLGLLIGAILNYEKKDFV